MANSDGAKYISGPCVLVFGFTPSNLGDGYIAAGRQTNFSDSLFYGTSDTVNEIGENLRFEALIAKVSNDGDSIWSRSYYTEDFCIPEQSLMI